MADENYRLKTKLPGGAEFEAQGSEEVVRALFSEFLAALRSAPIAPAELAKPAAEAGKDVPSDSPADNVASGVPRVVLDRFLVLGRDGSVTLRALPPTDTRDADALVVMLYGYQVIKGEHTVTGSNLKKAARQSGIQLDRIDRVLAPYGSWITTAGFKKGRRYGLNNQGIRKAEELLTQIMG